MTEIVILFLKWIFMLAGIVGIVGIVLLLPGVVIGFVLISKEKDEIRKKAKIKKGIIFAIAPFAFILIGFIGVVIVQAIQAMLNN
ncbi:MAG: hypothetical protein ACD_5C00036G0002 [uncultured bacterium]|nr:MAG: hypothetical protein ACD_5C00036G0002 [uncultured bacterium]